MLCDTVRADEKIAAVAYEAGFSDLSYFNRAFRRHYGVAPSEVRANKRLRSRIDGLGLDGERRAGPLPHN